MRTRMRERWGTFSVRDHMTRAPFVSDVLLYNRLIIPVPPAKLADKTEQDFWDRYDPEGLERCLQILKVKTARQDGLAITVPWDNSKRERFKNCMSAAAALATQHRDSDRGYYVDPFEMTRALVRDEFRPALPAGVSKAWTVAAYTSTNRFRQDMKAADPNRGQRLAALMKYQFLTPAQSDPNHDLLKKAVQLAATDSFRRKRAAFYAWQEEILEEEDIDDQQAVREMEQLLSDYNAATRKAFTTVVQKFAFALIPLGLSMTGALMTGTTAGRVIAGSAGIFQLTRFWKFDRKPVIDSGDLDAAAMIHDVRAILPMTNRKPAD